MYKSFVGNVGQMAQQLNEFEAAGNVIVSKETIPTNSGQPGLLVEYKVSVLREIKSLDDEMTDIIKDAKVDLRITSQGPVENSVGPDKPKKKRGPGRPKKETK